MGREECLRMVTEVFNKHGGPLQETILCMICEKKFPTLTPEQYCDFMEHFTSEYEKMNEKT